MKHLMVIAVILLSLSSNAIALDASAYTSIERDPTMKGYSMVYLPDYLNPQIKNLSASFKKNGSIAINFDYPSQKWTAAQAQSYPLKIVFYDRNGRPLNSFITHEKFVPQKVYDKSKSFYSVFKEIEPLKAGGNKLTYPVNQVIIDNTKKVEVGFWVNQPVPKSFVENLHQKRGVAQTKEEP